MGAKALFIENPIDKSNKVKAQQLSPAELPQGDPAKMPYTICGPYLKKLFDRAFIEGLHEPSKRPSAAEWEDALVKTTDLVQPCQNPNCEAKWFLYKWHANNLVSPSERISDADKKPVGDFHFFNNQWILINRNLPDMMDVTEKKTVAIGEYVPLTEGRQILLDKGQGGRLVVVQLVNN